LTTRAANPERNLSANLGAPIRSVKLYDLDGSGAIEELAATVKACWWEHVGSPADAAETGEEGRPH